MANDLTVNPLYFDTTGSVTGLQRIVAILWQSHSSTGNDIAADDDIQITDTKGAVLCAKRAEAVYDDLVLVFGYPGFVANGIKVTALDGGICLVYLA